MASRSMPWPMVAWSAVIPYLDRGCSMASGQSRKICRRSSRCRQVVTANQFWDHHGSIRTALPSSCKKTDKPTAALVTDLKRRGLLHTTLVAWGGEMGRLPVIQNDTGLANVGRDHNTYGFSY